MIKKLTISLLLTAFSLGLMAQSTPSYGDLVQVFNKRTLHYDLVWRQDKLIQLLSGDASIDSLYIDYGCDNAPDGWLLSGDTIYIDTCYVVEAGGADSLFVSYGCDLSYNEGSRLNGDTVFINTCYVDSVDVVDNVQFPMEYLRYKVDTTWDTVTTLIKPHGIMSGGYVTWLYDTTFMVQSCAYFIYGDFHASPQKEIKISSGDLTNPRIDIVIVDDADTASVIEGTPGEDPVKPQIDPTTQIELTQIYVPAGATSFDTLVAQEIIYDENIEWTGTGTGVTVNFAYGVNPYMGDSCADVGALTNGDQIAWATPTAVSKDSLLTFSFALKLKAAMAKSEAIVVQFFNGGTAVSSSEVATVDKTNLTWQNIVFDLNEFTWTGTLIDSVFINWKRTGGSHTGIYLDYVKLEGGIVSPISENSIELTGDITGSGIVGTPVETTLETVNANVGSFGAPDTTLTITADAKGRITSITKHLISLPASLETDPKYATDSANIVWWSDTTAVAGVGIATYSDIQGFLSAEVDGSVTNEGSLTVGSGGANDSKILSNTSGGKAVIISGGTNVTVTEADSTITIAASLPASGLEWADTTASAGVGIATFGDIRDTANAIRDDFPAPDNLGDHSATQDLNMNSYDIDAVDSCTVEELEITHSAGYDAVPSNNISANAVTIDWTTGNCQALVYADTCTFTFTAPPLPCHLTLIMTHADNTTVFPCTWPTGANGVVWPGGTAIVPTATANAVDIVSFFYNGTKYYGMFGNDFK